MNDIAFLSLTNGGYTMVDANWFPELNKERWSRAREGSVRQTTNHYIRNTDTVRNTTNRHRVITLHRVINGTPEGAHTDHINRHRNDNRARNLRTVTNAQNHWNTNKAVSKKGGFTSQYKGVSLHVNKGRKTKWVACILGKSIGRFDTELEAALCYDEAARSRFSQYARPNFL